MIDVFWALTATASWLGFVAACLMLFVLYTLATGRRLL